MSALPGLPRSIREVDEQAERDRETLERARKTISRDDPEPGALIYRRASDVSPRPVCWLWPGRIARGKVTVIAGHPGDGKSQITASLASVVTGGGLWPVDRTRADVGNVIILSAEDDAEDTIVPRLIAAGAVLSRCYVLDAVADGFTAAGQEVRRSFNLARDLVALETMLRRIGGANLIVIDPISAYLGEVDSHRNAEVRALLAPLADLAARHGAAVVGVSHLSKGSGGDARLRVNGSLAFVAAARAAWLVHRDADDPARRLFLPLKNNIGKDNSGLAYRIESATVGAGIESSRVTWESEPVTVSADDALNREPEKEPRASESAEQFLRDRLTDAGADGVPVRDLRAEARDAGLAWRTLERQKSELGVKAVRTGFGKAGGWVWTLPAYTASGSKALRLGGLCADQAPEQATELAFAKDRQPAKCESDTADYAEADRLLTIADGGRGDG